MIKLLKLQRPFFLIVLGVLCYIATFFLKPNVSNDYYLKELSGGLLMIGALWALYPILFAKRDNDGNAEIKTDPCVETPTEPKADSKED